MRWVLLVVLIGCRAPEPYVWMPAEEAPTVSTSAAHRCEPPRLRSDVLGAADEVTATGLLDPRFEGNEGFFRLEEAAPPPREGSSGPVQLELHAPEAVAVGDSFSVGLDAKNLTPVTRTLLRALDGSLERMREPHVDVYVRDAHGIEYVWSSVGERCGNVNSIQESDYVHIGPYQRANDFAGPWASHLGSLRIRDSGRFVLWVVYRDCGARDGGIRLGSDALRPTELGTFASNPVEITVR